MCLLCAPQRYFVGDEDEVNIKDMKTTRRLRVNVGLPRTTQRTINKKTPQNVAVNIYRRANAKAKFKKKKMTRRREHKFNKHYMQLFPAFTRRLFRGDGLLQNFVTHIL